MTLRPDGSVEHNTPSLGPGLLAGGVLIPWPAWAWQLPCPTSLRLPFGSSSRASEHGVLVLQQEGKIKGRVWGGTGAGEGERGGGKALRPPVLASSRNVFSATSAKAVTQAQQPGQPRPGDLPGEGRGQASG